MLINIYFSSFYFTFGKQKTDKIRQKHYQCELYCCHKTKTLINPFLISFWNWNLPNNFASNDMSPTMFSVYQRVCQLKYLKWTRLCILIACYKLANTQYKRAINLAVLQWIFSSIEMNKLNIYGLCNKHILSKNFASLFNDIFSLANR